MNNLFHSYVPEYERKSLMYSDIYRLVMELAANKGLMVSRCVVVPNIPNPYHGFVNDVWLSTPGSLRVMGIRLAAVVNDKGRRDLEVYVFDAFQSDATTVVASSDRVYYLSKSLMKSGTKASNKINAKIELAQRVETSVDKNAVITAVRNTHSNIVSTRRTTLNYKEVLSSSQISTLLKVFYGETTQLNVSADDRQAFDVVKAERDKRRDIRLDVAYKMSEFFAKPKWLVSYLEGHGYRVTGVDMNSTWEHIIKSETATLDIARYHAVTHPAVFCRSIDKLPNEQVRDNVSAALTFAKMHMSGRTSELSYSNVDGYDLMPKVITSRAIVSEELGAIFWTNSQLSMALVNQ